MEQRNEDKSVIYCFKKKYSFIFDKDGPKEFLYGLDYVNRYLKTKSISTGLYPQYYPLRIVEKALAHLSQVGCHFQIYLNNKKQINPNSILFGVEDGVSFGLLFFKLFGLLNNQIIVLIQGLHDRCQNYKLVKFNPLVKFLYRKLLFQADIILTLSNFEKNLLIKLFKLPAKKVKVLCFGADLDYWNKNKVNKIHKKDGFVLTLGNDMHRDYNLLLKSYNLNIPLHFVTKKFNKKQQQNFNKKNIFRHHRQVSNQRLRQLYHMAKFIIVPLKTTYATSGLSTIVQAMAMATPVLTAQTPALQELFTDYQHLLFYQVNNPSSFQQKLKELNQNQQLRSRLARNSKSLVAAKYNSLNMGKSMFKLFNSMETKQ